MKYARVFCDSFRVFLKISHVCTLLHAKLPCIIIMLRATCKSHHTSMQDTYVRNLEDNASYNTINSLLFLSIGIVDLLIITDDSMRSVM